MTTDLPDPQWESRPAPPADAPNVVVMVLDDTGFAQLGCFGSDIETPNIDRLAAGGLRYTNFHTTALCSPSRASLLTGRNHHSVGMRHLSNVDTGYSNCRGVIDPAATTMAEVLGSHGYNTFAIGKWHLANMEDCSPAGPFNHWPLQRGFDRFHGFLGGATDQFSPELVIDNHQVEPPNRDGYHVTEDMIDQAIAMVSAQQAAAPGKPWFTYVAFGATHSPHQAPPEYIAKYRGRYDAGWDIVRREWFDRQLELGIVPADATLSELNPGVEPWDTLSADEQALYARMQEVFAGFLDHTDAQVGRFLGYLEATEQLDNTLIVFMSDNGASREGGPNGVLNELTFFNGIETQVEDMIDQIDDIGGPNLFNNYPLGWAQVGNTPLRYYKSMTYEGGIRDPLIMHWPAGIGNAGEIRDQYHHIIDVAPTIYDCIGVEPPTSYRGVGQMPIEGMSMRYTFDAQTDSATRRSSQYYEMVGNRAIWSNGWKAVTMHKKDQPFEQDQWALFHTDTDFAEIHDLAAERPDKVAELEALWWSEAERYNVLPIDDRGLELWLLRRPDNRLRSTNHLRFPVGIPHVDRFNTPDIRNRSFTISADVTRQVGDQGVIVASGARTGGYSLYVLDGHLVFELNRAGPTSVIRSDAPLPVDDVTLSVRYAKEAEHRGTLSLLANDEVIGQGPLETLPFRQTLFGMDIGKDTGSTVSSAYQGPFAFQGQLRWVDYELVDDRDDLEQAARAEAEAALVEQ